MTVLTLQGFGMNAASMLDLTIPLVGESCLVASLRAPNQQYNDPEHGGAVGYHWGARAHSALNIRLHHDMVRATLEYLRETFDICPERTILAGFSQAVRLNYLFAGSYPDQVGGVLALCGGLPHDWDCPLAVPILHLARKEDQVFPAKMALDLEKRLRSQSSDVEFRMLPGAHTFPSEARGIVQEWIGRKFLQAPVARGL